MASGDAGARVLSLRLIFLGVALGLRKAAGPAAGLLCLLPRLCWGEATFPSEALSFGESLQST